MPVSFSLSLSLAAASLCLSLPRVSVLCSPFSLPAVLLSPAPGPPSSVSIFSSVPLFRLTPFSGPRDFFPASLYVFPVALTLPPPRLSPALRCPPHSHYELCGPCCPATCAGRQSCSGRDASGSRCCEDCVCDAGFVLSGAACVPAAKCGCFRAGRYRALAAVWYPGPGCARRCRCGPGGAVTCAPRPCRRGRVCGLHGGERQCLPAGRNHCALAGPAHVLAFDGRVLTLPSPASFPSERCLHVLARAASQGPCPFSLDAALDGTGLLSLRLNISGHYLQLDRTLAGVITVCVFWTGPTPRPLPPGSASVSPTICKMGVSAPQGLRDGASM